MAIPVLGFTIVSIGCLLGIGYFSVHRVTSSAYHTEGMIPSYVTAAVVGFFACFLYYSLHISKDNTEISSSQTKSGVEREKHAMPNGCNY